MSNIIDEQIKAYRDNFLQHGNTPQGTFQNDTVTQRERFSQLLAPLLKMKPDGFTICDIGSGMCDMKHYLDSLGIACTYTGIEIVPEMVEKCHTLYPGLEVLNADFLDPAFTRKFDFVVLSGTFNIPGAVTEADWESFIFAMVSKMFACAEIGISFNAITSHTTFRADDLYYLDPAKMLDYIQRNLGRFCTVNSNYPLYEFSYSVFTKQAVQERNQHEAFAKYFKN